MEIEFDLSERDILALVRRQQEYEPALRRRFTRLRYGYLIGFAILGIGSLLISQKSLWIVFLLLAIASFALFPTYNDWRIKRNVTRAYQNEKMRATLDKRIMRATVEGLEEITRLGEIKIKWVAIDNISVTPNYAFITINQLPSIVIPKRKVKEKFDDFVQSCQSFLQEANLHS